MAANVRSRNQRLQDLAFIADQLARRATHAQIHQRLNDARPYRLSLPQVRYDIQTLRKNWQDEAKERMEDYKAAEIRALDWKEREALEAWERSKGQSVKETTDRVATPATGQDKGTAVRLLHSKTVENRDGDPRFLAVAISCQERRARLLGLDISPSHAGDNSSTGEGFGVILLPTKRTDKPA